MPKTRTDFWKAKFSRNVERDQEHVRALESVGWRVIIIWECELKKQTFEDTMCQVQRQLLDTLYEDKPPGS